MLHIFLFCFVLSSSASNSNRANNSFSLILEEESFFLISTSTSGLNSWFLDHFRPIPQGWAQRGKEVRLVGVPGILEPILGPKTFKKMESLPLSAWRKTLTGPPTSKCLFLNLVFQITLHIRHYANNYGIQGNRPLIHRLFVYERTWMTLPNLRVAVPNAALDSHVPQ